MIHLYDLDILARTVMGEARGESHEGRVAVARCIVNRFRSGRWFAGRSIAATCQKPAQFSCWNERDPNRKVISAAGYDEPILRACMAAALDALDGKVPDWFTDQVTHYHGDWIATPKWARGQPEAGRIGQHIFYAGID